MKIALAGADLRSLQVELPGGKNEAIGVRSASGLSGTIEQSSERLALSDIAAEQVVLEALRLLLGELVLASESGATLTGLGLSLDDSLGQLTLAATLAEVAAQDLSVTIGAVHVGGRAKLVAPKLVVHGDEGSLASSHVEIADFVLRIGDVSLQAGLLRGVSVKIQWGAAGFRLAATTLETPTLKVALPDVELSAGAVAVASLTVDDQAIAVGRVALESGQVAVAFHPKKKGESASKSAGESVLAWETLDRLAGQLDVDVAVDLTVPIIGHRKATHRLRIAIAGGTLDYRALEHNLAKLEDALLDFSVRESALVLERVNPLRPTRGHGKPVVIWDVTGADLELAQQDRVRLSMLPKARLATDGNSEPPRRDSSPPKNSFALRELGLLRINARLALTELLGDGSPAPAVGQVRLRHVGSLVLGGNIHHEPGGSREGSLLGELADLSLSLPSLALGASVLSATTIDAAALSPIEITFADLDVTKLQVGLTGLSLEDVRVTL